MLGKPSFMYVILLYFACDEPHTVLQEAWFVHKLDQIMAVAIQIQWWILKWTKQNPQQTYLQCNVEYTIISQQIVEKGGCEPKNIQLHTNTS